MKEGGRNEVVIFRLGVI